MDYDAIIAHLKAAANPESVAGMARFGINPEKTLGVSLPDLRALAKTIGKDHALAGQLWESGIHEARILASIVEAPKAVTPEQMDHWVADFDSWDICDQCCSNLFRRTPYAYEKAYAWSSSEAEFIKRAGFVMMAVLAVHDKHAPDEQIADFLPVIERGAADERNFVKKAVNWALRQIGKRSRHLNERAIATARTLQTQDAKAARWVAADALRELTSDAVQARLR